jgi:hypothetical protein
MFFPSTFSDISELYGEFFASGKRVGSEIRRNAYFIIQYVLHVKAGEAVPTSPPMPRRRTKPGFGHLRRG